MREAAGRESSSFDSSERKTVLVARPRQPARQLIGLGLVAYGLIGIGIFVAVALAVSRPLERARSVSQAVEDQRAALVEALDQAELTIAQMSTGVGRMDTSLSDARAATDRAAGIATGVSSSMFQLRDSMMITIPILGGQPLAGLAGGFDVTGQQLELLSQDLAAIGTALETNRTDVGDTATNMRLLAESVGDLTTAVREGPTVDISVETLDATRLAVYAIAGWLALLAIGCVVGGLYLIATGRRRVA